jgi:hypothetical protein
MSEYLIAGRDLEWFVNEWLAAVALDDHEKSLLDAASEAGKDGNFDSEYLFNAAYLYSQIGPRAAEHESSPEELLLAAVLAVYQNENSLFRGMRWVSQTEHVARAFRFARETGDAGMAQKLIAHVLRRGEDRPEGWKVIQTGNAEKDPAKAAYWDGKMAELDQRELRAAALFNPNVDFDRALLDPGRGSAL